MRFWLGLALLLSVWTAHAHPLAPALLQLTETAAGDFDVVWRQFVLQPSGTELQPLLPSSCQRQSAIDQQLSDNGALTEYWTVRCDTAALAGETIRIQGLTAGRATVILRLDPRDGPVLQSLLDASRPILEWPQSDGVSVAFLRYFPLGIGHLWSGYDHLLFLLALVLLLRNWRRLALAVTAFTVGHSLSLALATLRLVTVNTALVECLIAASIVWLAVELAAGRGQRSLVSRHPGLMPAALGLLHGLGFASVLEEIGLPDGEIAMALLGFNLGIEAGQLIFVAACLSALAMLRHWPWPRLGPVSGVAVSYAIGAVSAWWFWSRGAALLV